MLFLFHYSNLNSARLETYTQLKLNNLSYKLIINDSDYPYDIIETSFENINLLLKRLGLIKHISVFLGYNNELHPWYKKYNLSNQLDLINFIEKNDFYKEKGKRGRFFKVNFYKKEMNEKFCDLIDKHGNLLENKEINSEGTLLEINIYKEKILLSIFYQRSLRKELLKFDVKNLDFIGRTSMHVENCILISNLTNVKENQIVYDPFCGSGSLLNIPAYFKCKVIGSDISKNEMIGKNIQKGKVRTLLQGYNVYSNFSKFNLLTNVISFLQSDINHSPLIYADVIITDIPYGIRISIGNELMFYIDSLFKLALKILPKDGILAFFAPTVQIKNDFFILINQYEEKKATVLRTLYIFKKC